MLSDLTEARKKIENKVNWTKGALAKDMRNRVVNMLSPNACKWCALGAIGTTFCPESTVELLRQSAKELFDLRVQDVNDFLGYEAVLVMYDHAIEIYKEEECT